MGTCKPTPIRKTNVFSPRCVKLSLSCLVPCPAFPPWMNYFCPLLVSASLPCHGHHWAPAGILLMVEEGEAWCRGSSSDHPPHTPWGAGEGEASCSPHPLSQVSWPLRFQVMSSGNEGALRRDRQREGWPARCPRNLRSHYLCGLIAQVCDLGELLSPLRFQCSVCK